MYFNPFISSSENDGQIPGEAVVRPVCGIFGIIRLVAGNLSLQSCLLMNCCCQQHVHNQCTCYQLSVYKWFKQVSTWNFVTFHIGSDHWDLGCWPAGVPKETFSGSGHLEYQIEWIEVYIKMQAYLHTPLTPLMCPDFHKGSSYISN